jgi:small subunit ribosomal protein S3Ae
MAKKRSARQAARTSADKWQEKQWYTIRAPAIFNDAEIGETLADEEEKLEDRVAEATLQDVTGDFSKQHVKCYFRIRGTRGTDAVTTFDGHDLTSDYVRRLVRRSHSKIDVVHDVTTSDGFTVRLKPMIVSERRTQEAQRKEIRKRAREVCEEASNTDFSDLVLDVLEGDVAKEIYEQARLILPLKRVEVRKSEVVSEPEDATETLDVFAPPEDEETEEADEAEDVDEDEPAEEPEEAEETDEGEPAEEPEEAEETDEAAETEDEAEEVAEDLVDDVSDELEG